MATVKKGKSPSAITCRIIKAAMGAADMNAEKLAKRMNVHINTVYRDLKEPERIPQDRLWLYFTALGVPVNESLQTIANQFAFSIVQRG